LILDLFYIGGNMRKLVFAFVLCGSSVAFGQSSPSDRPVVNSGFNLATGERLVAVNGVPVGQTVTHAAPAPLRAMLGLAQQKAQQQAAEGKMRHVGGGFGNGNYEGVDFSTVSPDAAIKKCCYWGQRPPVDIGVARGINGWYATVIYR
jgi:hypothetical protein